MMKRSVGVLAFFTLLFCIGLSSCDGSTSGNKQGDGIFAQLAAPSNVSAAATASSIELSWHGVADANYYIVYRSSGGSYEDIGSSVLTSYSDSAVSPDTTYSYRVSAVNSAGEGEKSAAVEATYIGDAGEGVYLEE